MSCRSSHFDLPFQTVDETWQAYNFYVEHNFYGVNGTFDFENRAYKDTYHRLFNTRIMEDGRNWVFNAEYLMVQWLEANGTM